ncbi:MAG TPA: DUF1501 domain-containing protein [Gemmataceae bacterium]|jgi:hypothetical protein|nr:DUF1501 domain-containing protein [Gemmataceae bacterium]
MLDVFSRRDFLRVGAVGALGLPALLRGEAHAAGQKARAKSVLLVYLGGGLSHHDSFDLKPDAPAEIRGKYKSIDSVVPGLRVGELLPRMAKVMNRLTLVRSGAHNNDHHETATNWVLCGRFGSAFGDYPAMGAVVAHETGFTGQLPPYVSIPRNPSFTWELGKSAFLGGRYESFKTGDPNAPGFKVQDVSPAEPVSAQRAKRRRTLLQAVDGLARQVEGNDQIATYDEFHERAATMILSAEARSAFAVERESDRLRDRYGRNTFGQSCLLARRLVERGVRFVTINNGGWDHHSKIWDGLGHRLPQFDQGFSALLEDMHARGLLAETLVLVMGEFGRTPKINKDVGRDHWGPAASLLFAGAGVREGQVLGATDKQGAYVTRRPVAPADVACTVFEALGIDPRKQLLTPDGRPVEILDKGETVKELFA